MIRSRSVSAEGEGGGARLFLAASLAALVLYVRTLAPTVTAEDSGELITAAYTLGIAHPPGYPLWCILGKVFTWIPLGTVAWRVNLLSAVLGAAAVGVLALIAHRFTRSFWASFAGALIFATSRDFWGQAVIAEVYTLNVLLFLILLLFVLYFEDTRKTRWLYLAATVLGLALTNHSTILPLAPVFFGWVFLRHRELFRKPILIANLVAGFLLGFSIILYLPMRSAIDPVMDWGNPETLTAAWDHFLRRQYSAAEEPRARSILGQGLLVWRFLETFAGQFTPWVAALAVPGLFENRRRERSTFYLLAILFLLTSYGFIWLLNYPADRENLYLTRVFFLPAFAIGAVWIAMGLTGVGRWARERFSQWPETRASLLRTACALVVFLPLARNFAGNDQSANYLACDWGRNMILSLKPSAIIAPSADHSTFPLLYLQTVEGLRLDVLIADKYGYIDEEVFEELFRSRDPPRVAPPRGGDPFEKERYLVEHSGRPVYFTTKSRIPGLETHELVSWGLAFEVSRKGEKPDKKIHDELWQGFQFHPGNIDCAPGKFAEDLILSDYHYARARRFFLFGREKEALEAVATSERYGFGVKEIHNNLGGMLAEAGKAEEAIPYLLRAIAIDPNYDLAANNLASAYCALKRYREGLRWFDRALEVEPENPVFRLGKARAHRDMGHVADAYFAYLRVWRADPRNEALRDEIKKLVEERFGKDSKLADLSVPAPRAPREDPFDDGFPEGAAGLSGRREPWAMDPGRGIALPPDPLEALGN